ncbi:hypothetical protein JCM8547_008380 [Rhodosporidiobolus lusitaniae]
MLQLDHHRTVPSPSPTSSHFTPSDSLNSSSSSLSPSPTSTSASLSPSETPKTHDLALPHLANPAQAGRDQRALEPAEADRAGGLPSHGLAVPAPPSPASRGGRTPTGRASPARESDDDAASVNPLFALGERARAGEVDPARIVIQKDGVVVREGTRSPAFFGRGKTVVSGQAGNGTLAAVRGGHGHHEAFHLFHHRGVHHEHGNGNGQPDQREGETLRLDAEGENGGGATQDGEPSQVEHFVDKAYEQDRSDAFKIKMRDARADLRDRLEEGGWVTPTEEKEPEEVLEPRLAAMLERQSADGAAGTASESEANGGASFYSAASEVASSSASTVEASPAFLPSVPPRSESPLSYTSLSEIHLPTPPPSAQHPPASTPAAPANPDPVPSSSRLSPLLEQPLPIPRKPRSSSLLSSSPSRSAPNASPSLSYDHSPSFLPLPGSSGSRIPSGGSLSASPPPMSVTPPSMRRSNTTGSPSLLAAASSSTLSVPGTAPLAPSSSGQRRTSFASGRIRGGSLSAAQRQERSNSHSPSLAHAQLYPHPSSSTNPYLPTSSSQQSHLSHLQQTYSPSTQQPARSPSIVLDDVDASIAAQAEAIRRQRQEKRFEAEQEAAKAERDRERERNLPIPTPSSGAATDRAGTSTGASTPGLGAGLTSPGALLKRRSTRMGSGSSQADAAAKAGKTKEDAALAAASAAAVGQAAGDEGGEMGISDEAAVQPTPGPSSGRMSRAAGHEEERGDGAGVLVGNLIGQDHANYVLMYNMLTGIRIGVSRCQAKAKRPLTDADYTARHKFSFDIVGNELTPSVKYDFKFKDYAPWVFRELREYFYLDPSDYLVSLTAKYILSELGSPGKSGSFFYFSRDYRFIIKTIRHSEHKFLRSILKDYHTYVKNNPHTLISRFYGLHRVKLPHGRKIHFVIMNNLFPPHRDIHETYDLKGSAIGRLYPEEKAAHNPHAVLKDLNWVLRHRQLALGPEKKALFEEQLRRDTELLQRLKIMDYSLLTGIHNGVRGNSEGLREDKLSVFQPATVKVRRKPTQIKRDADASALRKAVERSDPRALGGVHELPEEDTSERRLFLFYQDEGGMCATGDNNEDLGVIYYLGIIDILTPYTFVKRVEHLFKGFQHDKHMISAVPPKEYGDRFLSFIKSIIRGNDESQRPRMFENKAQEEEVLRRGGSATAPPPNVSEDDAEVQREKEDGGGGGEAKDKSKEQ